MAAMLADMQKLLAPSLAFHASADKAGVDDVRFQWEVKAIRGKDEFFCQVSGVSTMPGLLDPHRLHQAAELVSVEMIEKIARPMSGKFQLLSNETALADLDADQDRPRRPIGLPFPSNHDEDLAVEVAAAAISHEDD